jgi:hypothetical protein
MKTIGNISAILGILGFFIPYLSSGTLNQLNLFQFISIGFSIALIVIMAVYDWVNRPQRYRSSDQIQNYMYDWVSQTGRVVIFTRDMSWVNETIKRKLIEKSKESELIVCMPKANALAGELQSYGARIVEYNRHLTYTPESRFTIVRFGRSDARIAIGIQNENEHLIEEFSNGHHPLFHVAHDLVNILMEADYAGRNL